jgi:hypothetical protein
MSSSIPRETKKETTDAWVAEAIWKVGLLTDATTIFPDWNNFYDYAATEVPNGNGYTTGGETLTGRTSTYDGNNAKLTADNVVWLNATFSCRYAVLYETAQSKIRAIFDLGSQTVNNGTLTLIWNASGILTVE